MRQKPTQKNPNKKEPKQNEAITMRMQKFSRPGVILLATVVVIITSIVVANATQSLTTPNTAFISYSLAGGASSAPITPATNKSVLVMGCGTTNILGVGQVSFVTHLQHLDVVGRLGIVALGDHHLGRECRSRDPHSVHRRQLSGHPDGQQRHDPCPQ